MQCIAAPAVARSSFINRPCSSTAPSPARTAHWACCITMLACATTQDQRSVIAAGASPDHAEIAAAGGVGMRVADYRALVVRVDSVLRGSRELDVRTRHLDSLRVQLTVLRTHMNARQSSQPASTQNPQSRSRQCNERR